MNDDNLPPQLANDSKFNNEKEVPCPDCNGDYMGDISACCGSWMDSDIMICSSCREHADCMECETCSCNGSIII